MAPLPAEAPAPPELVADLRAAEADFLAALAERRRRRLGLLAGLAAFLGAGAATAVAFGLLVGGAPLRVFGFIALAAVWVGLVALFLAHRATEPPARRRRLATLPLARLVSAETRVVACVGCGGVLPVTGALATCPTCQAEQLVPFLACPPAARPRLAAVLLARSERGRRGDRLLDLAAAAVLLGTGLTVGAGLAVLFVLHPPRGLAGLPLLAAALASALLVALPFAGAALAGAWRALRPS